MALVVCQECKAQISDQAKACPQCGAPIAKSTPAAKGNGGLNAVLIIVATIVALMVISPYITAYKKAKMTPEEIRLVDAAEAEKSNDMNARFVCTNFVRDSLKAPSTAEFQSSSEYLVKKQPDGSFAVAGIVDSQNSFGAKLRGAFACTVKPTSDGKWRLVEPVTMISK